MKRYLLIAVLIAGAFAGGVVTADPGGFGYDLIPTSDDTYALGDDAERWTEGHFSRSLSVGGIPNTNQQRFHVEEETSNAKLYSGHASTGEPAKSSPALKTVGSYWD